jgi:hypothetical protein
MQSCQKWKFGLVITMEKGAWSLAGTKLPGKVRLLARILVKTMAMTSIWIMCFLRCHQLTPIIGCGGLGLHCIPRILERVAPYRSNGRRS